MKYRLLILVLILGLGIFTYSCAEGSDADRAADEIAIETQEAMRDFGAEIKAESSEMSREFKKARTNINQRMAAINAEIENASGDAKEDLQEEWNELERMGNDIDDRMRLVGDNMQSGWKDFEGDIKNGWNDFRKESSKLLEIVERATDPEKDLD